MYRIYIVEDDRGIAQAICRCAESWGMEPVCAADLHDVMGQFAAVQPHLVLLDIALPFMDGYHWCREIRHVSSVPILFLSSAADNMNIIMAMNMGADDFIAKPFDSSVLAAKLNALLRRAYDFGRSRPVLEHRGAILQTGENTLTYRGETVALTKNEYRIVLTLMENKGKVVSRERLMETLWKTDCFVGENTLTVNVSRVRRKLEDVGLKGFIVTKSGQGYTLGEEP